MQALPGVPLRLLRAVAGVAQCGSAARAAGHLHLSVSAVTRAVLRAEAMLGLALFERGARGMVPTPAGQVLVARVRRAWAELALAQSAAGRGPAARENTLARQVTEAMLEALAAVAEARSEGAAARRLGVSQAAVHQALRQLEHASRLHLFERSRRGTRLTDAGERLLLRGKLALAELRIGHDEISAWRGLRSGRVAVGVLPMAGDVLVPQALARLFKAEPGVVATVADGTYEALLHQLRHADVDLIVGPLRGEQAAPEVQEQLLFVDRLVPVVRSAHPLLARGRPRTLRTLLRWPWIGPLPGTPAGAAFERAFAAAGLPAPAVSVQVNSPAVVRSVLCAGEHVALLSPLQIRAEVAAGLLCVLPVPVQGTERPIGIAQRRDGLASAASRALVRELETIARHIAA